MMNGEAREVAIRVRDRLTDRRERDALAEVINAAHRCEQYERAKRVEARPAEETPR